MPYTTLVCVFEVGCFWHYPTSNHMVEQTVKQIGESLRGRKSYCRACRAMFASLEAFDEHRIGDFKRNQRRCMTAKEMRSHGMQAVMGNIPAWAKAFLATEKHECLLWMSKASVDGSRKRVPAMAG